MTISADRIRSVGERLLLVCLCLGFVLLLLFSLERVDSQLFGWLGLHWNPPGGIWMGLSVVMAVLPSLWMPIELKRPSHFAYWALYLMVIVPGMTVPYHVLARSPEDVLMFTTAILTCFTALGVSMHLPTFVIKRPDIDPKVFYGVVAGIVVVCALVTWATVGFKLDFGVADIYVRRHAARNVFAQQSAVSYIKGNLASALAPFAVAVGAVRRQWLLLAAGLFGSLIVFSVEGSRSAALLPVFIFAMYPVVSKFPRYFGFALVGGFLVLLGVSVGSYLVAKFPGLPLVVSWRFALVKGLLSAYYWDFFSTHPHVFYADGFLKGIMPNPYPLATPRMIGLTYFNSAETNSNANIFAAAYGDFGYLGMAFITLLTGAYFRLLDSFSVNRGFVVVVFLAGFIGVKWTDVAFDTAILSHGMLVVTLLLYWLPDHALETKRVPVSQGGEDPGLGQAAGSGA